MIASLSSLFLERETVERKEHPYERANRKEYGREERFGEMESVGRSEDPSMRT